MRSKLVLYSCVLVLTYSCTKDGAPIFEVDDGVSNDGKVYVLNEGTFGQSNASVDRYDVQESSVEREVYKKKNGNSPGDVVLSMASDEDYLYVVVNNSGNVHVCTAEMENVMTISGFRSPRYFLKISPTTGYVTNFLLSNGPNEIDIVDLQSNEIVSKIEVNGWCEQMILLNGFVYVLNPGEDKILKINISSHQIVSEKKVAKQPLSMQVDGNGMLWVLSTGGFSDQIPAITQIDPLTMETKKTLEFNSVEDFPTWLCVNASGDSLFYINDGVFALSINDNIVPNTPFIDNNMTYMYAMALDLNNNTLYVSDGKDFQQQGEVSHFNTRGELINQFDCGVGPGNFYFHQ